MTKATITPRTRKSKESDLILEYLKDNGIDIKDAKINAGILSLDAKYLDHRTGSLRFLESFKKMAPDAVTISCTETPPRPSLDDEVRPNAGTTSARITINVNSEELRSAITDKIREEFERTYSVGMDVVTREFSALAASMSASQKLLLLAKLAEENGIEVNISGRGFEQNLWPEGKEQAPQKGL